MCESADFLILNSQWMANGILSPFLPISEITFHQARLVSCKVGSCVLCPSFPHPLKHSQFLPYDHPRPLSRETRPLGGDAGSGGAGTSLALPACVEFSESLTTFAGSCWLSGGGGEGGAAPALHSVEALIGPLFDGGLLC